MIRKKKNKIAAKEDFNRDDELFVCPDINCDCLPKHEWEGRIRNLVEIIAETDEIRAAILAIKSLNDTKEAQNCLRTIEKCFTDIVLHPDDDLYRQLFTEDLEKCVSDVEGGRRLLEAAGFEAVSIDSGRECFIFLPPDPEFLLDVVDLMNTIEGFALIPDSRKTSKSFRSGSSGVCQTDGQRLQTDRHPSDDIAEISLLKNSSQSSRDLAENINSIKMKNKIIPKDDGKVKHDSTIQMITQNYERQESKSLTVETLDEKGKETNEIKSPTSINWVTKSTVVKATLPKKPVADRASRRTVYSTVNHNITKNKEEKKMAKRKQFSKPGNKNASNRKVHEFLHGESDAGLVSAIVTPQIADAGTSRPSAKSRPLLSSTRVRVRLPEGGVVEGDFAIDDLLGSVRKLLNEKPGMSYTLHRTTGERIPDADFHKSFRQLGLCGSLFLRLRWSPSDKDILRGAAVSEQTLVRRGDGRQPSGPGSVRRRYLESGPGDRTVKVSVQTPGRALAAYVEMAKASKAMEVTRELR